MGLLLVLAITFVAFIPALNNEFNNWDDDRYVTDNELLKDLSASTVADIFNPNTGIINYGYTPLPVLTFAIEKQIWGLNPLPYHINNLLLHACRVGYVGNRAQRRIVWCVLFSIYGTLCAVGRATTKTNYLFNSLYIVVYTCFVFQNTSRSFAFEFAMP